MLEPTLKEYSKLLMIIFDQIILKYTYVTVIAIISCILVFISTYYTTQLAEASHILLSKNSEINFSDRLFRFLRISLIALSLKRIPKTIFTYIVQLICRNKFVETLRDYMNLPYYKFHKKTPGEIRFVIFLKSLSYPICAQIVVFDFTTILGMTIFTFIRTYKDVSKYAAIVFFLFPIIYIWYMLIFLKKRIVYRTRNLIEQEKTSSKIYDKLSNFDVIKTYNLENSEVSDLQNSIKGQIDAQIATDIYTAKGNYFARYILIAPYVIVGLIYCMGPAKFDHALLYQATLLYSVLTVEIKKLGHQLYRLSTYLNQIGYDSDIFAESENNINIICQSTYFQEKIEFRNVTIYHDNKMIVENANCEIRKNEKIAIVGKNGTGKSTFIKTILGFTTYTGEVLIDGVDIKNMSPTALFSMISYISQDDYTSDDTVLNNLKLGNKNATKESIIEVAKMFDSHEMIMKFENAYDTHAGIRGNKLSGGQRQTLSLIRAAVKNSSVFILDEATSAIDKKYEIKVLDILLNKLEEKTLAMIIHEKKYLPSFDKVFFLNNQKLEDVGSFEELIARNSNFKKFVTE